MARERITVEVVRRALEKPTPNIRKLLDVLWKDKEFVSASTIGQRTGMKKAGINATFASISRNLRRQTGFKEFGRDICDEIDGERYRLRDDLRSVVGEILGEKREVRVSGMKISIASVSRTSVDHSSVIYFEVKGLDTGDIDPVVSVTVPARSGNTRQVVERGCDVLLAQLNGLVQSLESTRENLSHWE